jgi:hypothetical protein
VGALDTAIVVVSAVEEVVDTAVIDVPEDHDIRESQPYYSSPIGHHLAIAAEASPPARHLCRVHASPAATDSVEVQKPESKGVAAVERM